MQIKQMLLGIAALGMALTPVQARALLALPLARVHIIVKTMGDDQVFPFQVFVENGAAPLVEFSVPTNNLTGAYDITLEAWPSNYTMKEILPPGTIISSIDCQALPISSVLTENNVISFNLAADNDVTCTINHQIPTTRNPVLIIPGIGGTELTKDSDLLWLNLPRIVNPFGSDDFLNVLGFNPDLSSADSGIKVKDVIRRKQVSGTDITLYNYTQGLLDEFTSLGYEEGTDLFLFPYDWRLGVSQNNVKALKAVINNVSRLNNGLAVDVVAHSLGGLLLKQYAIENPQEHLVREAVMVGVPHLGAPKALKMLLQGDNFGIPFLDEAVMKQLVHNMPAVYQLAPSIGYYQNQGSYYQLRTALFWPGGGQDLNYIQMRDRLLTEKSLNTVAWHSAEELHQKQFDDYDLRDAGIDSYSIVGCGSGTFGKLIESRLTGDYKIQYVSGDGTVPVASSTAMPVDPLKIYYDQKISHGTMLSEKKTREQIADIIARGVLINSGQYSDVCPLNGHAISIFSPLTILAVDALGNRAGMDKDGASYKEIPGSDFSLMGEHKFLYLPDDDRGYDIALAGTGEGIFSLTDEVIQNGEIIRTTNYIDVPVSLATEGRLVLDDPPVLNIYGQEISETPPSSESFNMLKPEAAASTTASLPSPIFFRNLISDKSFLWLFTGKFEHLVVTEEESSGGDLTKPQK